MDLGYFLLKKKNRTSFFGQVFFVQVFFEEGFFEQNFQKFLNKFFQTRFFDLKLKKTQRDDRNRPKTRAMTVAVIAPFPLFRRPRPCGGEHSFLRASHFLRAIERMTSLAERWYLVLAHRFYPASCYGTPFDHFVCVNTRKSYAPTATKRQICFSAFD